MTAVVFLQNAWSPLYAGGRWPRASWLRALGTSRSGQRLARIEAAAVGVDIWYDNTTPIVGETPDSVVPVDHAHVAHVLATRRPDMVVACGSQAWAALRAWDRVYPILVVPHPARRVLTNALYTRAGDVLRDGFTGVVQLNQRKGYIEWSFSYEDVSRYPRRTRDSLRRGDAGRTRRKAARCAEAQTETLADRT